MNEERIMKKLAFSLVTILLLLIFSHCVSHDKKRFPNASEKAVISQGVDEIDSKLGTLIVEWENNKGDGDEDNHTPIYQPVSVKVSVVCKGSNTRFDIENFKTCHYFGFDTDAKNQNVIYLGLGQQTDLIAEPHGNQLKINKENDKLCNGIQEAVINLQNYCK